MQEVKWKSRFNKLAVFTILFFCGCVYFGALCMSSSDEYVDLNRSYEDLGYECDALSEDNKALKAKVEELKQELSEKPQ